MYKTGILCAQFALVAVVIEVFIGVVVTATTDDGDDNVVGDDNYDVVVAVTVTSANDEDEKQDNIRSKIKSKYIMQFLIRIGCFRLYSNSVLFHFLFHVNKVFMYKPRDDMRSRAFRPEPVDDYGGQLSAVSLCSYQSHVTYGVHIFAQNKD